MQLAAAHYRKPISMGPEINHSESPSNRRV
jgi:hypothetical protein